MLYQTCIKTQELQSLFLSPTEVAQEGVFSDESLGHVSWLRTVLCSWTPLQQMLRGLFLTSPDAQFQCKTPCYSRPFHFVIYDCAFESYLFSPLLPQVYFSAYTETKAACLLHLGCLWQTNTAVFLTVRGRQRRCRLAGLPCFPVPLTAGTRDRNWNSSVGRLPLWVTILTRV